MMGRVRSGGRRLAFFMLASQLCSAAALAETGNRQAVAGGAGVTAAAASKTYASNPVLDQLTGTWDVAYEYVAKDGKLKHNRGQVHYSWILDGKALQEIWTSDSEGADLRPYGTTINFYDPKQQRWTAVWVYPKQGMTTVVSGGDVNGSYVLTGRDEAGALQRWSTSVVRPDTIVGRFELSRDDGRTWRQVGVNHMRRHRE